MSRTVREGYPFCSHIVSAIRSFRCFVRWPCPYVADVRSSGLSGDGVVASCPALTLPIALIAGLARTHLVPAEL